MIKPGLWVGPASQYGPAGPHPSHRWLTSLRQPHWKRLCTKAGVSPSPLYFLFLDIIDFFVDGKLIIDGWKERIAKWATVRKECSDLNIDDLLHNWGACMRMGLSKKKKSAAWCAPPIGVLKFNVDGAARGKRGWSSSLYLLHYLSTRFYCEERFAQCNFKGEIL